MLNNEMLNEYDLKNILLWKKVAGTSPDLAEKKHWKNYEHDRHEIRVAGIHGGTLTKIELMVQKIKEAEKKEPESMYEINLV